jgi:DNA-binding LacI/PurR family transcriptional regulator
MASHAQTIARDLGVSRATVSNAYVRPDHLSAALRVKILEYAENIGYVGPHAGARSLRSGQAHAIAVVFSEELTYAFRDPAISLFLQGVGSVLEKSNKNVLVVPTGNGTSEPGNISDCLVDGFILYSVRRSDPVIDVVRRRRLPIVTVDGPTLEGHPSISVDNVAAGYACAEHLARSGYRDIAVLTALVPPNRHEGLVEPSQRKALFGASKSRIAGVEKFCATNNLPPPRVVSAMLNDEESAARALAASTSVLQGVSAIVAMSDLLAMGAVNWSRANHDELGRAIAVTGFDDIREASVNQLTTVRQPLREKGVLAGELIVAECSGQPRQRTRHVLPWKLVTRNSTTEVSMS